MFTVREHAVLSCLQQGRSNKQIAYDLKLSENTVKVHVRNIMQKLKAHNRTEVAYLTRQNGWFAGK
jgi:DNA-binding NarL/FixJ family response regulator